MDAFERLNTQDEGEHLIALSATCHLPRMVDRSLSAEKHACIVLTREARDGLYTRDKAERFMAATGHHLEDVMATYRPPNVAGDASGQSSSIQSTRMIPTRE